MTQRLIALSVTARAWRGEGTDSFVRIQPRAIPKEKPMPRFTLLCSDKPGALELRMATREAHLAFVHDHLQGIRAAGPLLDAEGNMNGSFFLIDAEDAAAVEAFSQADPYRRAGLFERVEIRCWRQSVGEPI